MGKSVESNHVAPAQFVDDPQSHFSKIRLEEDYHVELNGKHIKSNRLMTMDVTDRLKQFHQSSQEAKGIDVDQNDDDEPEDRDQDESTKEEELSPSNPVIQPAIKN